MKIWLSMSIGMVESEYFRHDVQDHRRRGRKMEVHNAYVSFDADGNFDHAWLNGPLVLLNGNLSVDDQGESVLVRDEKLLPEPIRQAIEEGATHAQ